MKEYSTQYNTAKLIGEASIELRDGQARIAANNARIAKINAVYDARLARRRELYAQNKSVQNK